MTLRRLTPLALTTLLLLSTSGCTVFDIANAISPPITTSRVVGIPYATLPPDQRQTPIRQKLDVYWGHQVKPTSHAPVIIFFYGGGWQTGDRADYAFLARALAEEGLVVIVPDYGKYPNVVFPEFVRDGARAVKWAHDHAAEYGGDPNRLFVMGHSAGGHIASLLAYDPRYLAEFDLPQSTLAGFIGLAAPYDFTPREIDLPVFALKEPTTRGSITPDIEPIEWASPSSPPTLLLQGLSDTVIKSDQPTKLATKLRAAHVPVTFLEYPNTDHIGIAAALLWPLRHTAPVRKDIIEFVKSYK